MFAGRLDSAYLTNEHYKHIDPDLLTFKTYRYLSVRLFAELFRDFMQLSAVVALHVVHSLIKVIRKVLTLLRLDPTYVRQCLQKWKCLLVPCMMVVQMYAAFVLRHYKLFTPNPTVTDFPNAQTP